MKRLIVVYNPRSSQFGRVRDEVLAESRKLKGWTVGKFEVKDTDVDDNAAKLAELLSDGDLVVSAGGDGTATITLNGVMLSKADGLKLGVLPYGNFNDTARTFGTKNLQEIIEGKTMEAWGMECLINGRHWRWAMCYFTIGLFAESARIFDQKDNRKELRTGRRGMFYSIWLLKKWYMKNRKRQFLADFVLNRDGEELRCEGMTDYVAVNGKSMARAMRGGEWFLDEKKFLSETRSLRKLLNLGKLMMRSVLVRIPGEEAQRNLLTFDKPAEIMIQAEGEYRKLKDVKTMEVRKAEKPVKVMMRN